jgi:hypothetical protein
MLFLGGNEDHVAGPDRADAFVGFHRRVAADDEIEVLAILMQVQGRCRAFFVVHDPGQHVIDVGEFLIDEKDAFAPRHDRDQRRQFNFLENIGHRFPPSCVPIFECRGSGARRRR